MIGISARFSLYQIGVSEIDNAQKIFLEIFVL